MENIFENQPSVWETLKNAGKPIVLYGMGDGADKVIRALEVRNTAPGAVMASDDFVRGQYFRGFKVQKLSDIEKQYEDFVIALCFGSQLDEVMTLIKGVAEKHTMLVPSVPVYGDNIFDGVFVKRYYSLISRAYDLFEDEKSRNVYKNILLFEYTGQLSYLFRAESPKKEAFREVLRLGDNELYADLGACKGDTVEEFLDFVNGYEQIIALEPNKKNFEKLKESCKALKNTELWNLAAWSKEENLFFNKKTGRSSAAAAGGIPVQGAALDGILNGNKVTYIKMDVEGSEAKAIAGAAETIRRYKPKLNIAAYHRSEDIFTLPLLINSLNPDYKIYLRHHPYIPFWDTNLYCV